MVFDLEYLALHHILGTRWLDRLERASLLLQRLDRNQNASLALGFLVAYWVVQEWIYSQRARTVAALVVAIDWQLEERQQSPQDSFRISVT